MYVSNIASIPDVSEEHHRRRSVKYINDSRYTRVNTSNQCLRLRLAAIVPPHPARYRVSTVTHSACKLERLRFFATKGWRRADTHPEISDNNARYDAWVVNSRVASDAHDANSRILHPAPSALCAPRVSRSSLRCFRATCPQWRHPTLTFFYGTKNFPLNRPHLTRGIVRCFDAIKFEIHRLIPFGDFELHLNFKCNHLRLNFFLTIEN